MIDCTYTYVGVSRDEDSGGVAVYFSQHGILSVEDDGSVSDRFSVVRNECFE